MKSLAFAVYDVKGEAFGMPIFQRTKGEALRAFEDECNREGSMLCSHPEDYSLFLIGEYDQGNGLISPVTHLQLGTALEAKRAPQLTLTPATPEESTA